MKATPLSRQSLPEKPYLWRGSSRLAEVNDQLFAERDGKPQREPGYFSWPMPLPGPVHPAGNWTPKQAPGDGERTQVA